ncbi:MAG: tripartite tricarboxylate transporter substrate binding protein [Betaproteobacteria bacterium]
MSVRFLCCFLIALPALVFAQAPAGWKPERPVELIIGAAPGGANDRIGRALQRVLQDAKLANPVVVVNKPAFSYLASHEGNPHYLGLASSSWLTTVAAGQSAVTHRDVTPIIKMLDEYQVYFVRNDSAIRTAQDIISRLKQDPGSVSFGFSTASGNPLHISIAMLARAAGADARKLTTVVYTSGANTAIQVAGGHLDVGVQSPGSAWQLAQAGKIRLLAVAGPRRYPGELANVPTLREQGINSDANVFYTIFAPKGINAAQTAWWDQAITSVMQSEQIKKDAEFNRWTIDLIGHRELPAFLEREHDNYRRALAELGLQK